MSNDLEMKIRIGSELKEIRTALGQLQGDIRKVGAEGKGAGKTAGKGMDQLSAQIKTLKRQALGFIGVWASISTLKGIGRLADQYKEVNARLKLASRSQEEFISNQELIFQLAQDTRSEYKSTVDLYDRISRSTKELGTSQADRLKVTEAINKAIKVSGANSESANAAIVQLGQGLAAGALRGEELNSVLEQTPRLAEAIAAGMGVSLGQLRQLGSEGKITAETIIQALLSQSQAIDEEFRQLPLTIDQAITTIENGFIRWIGQTDEAYGATKALAEGLLFLGENMEQVIEIAIRAAALIATAYGFKAVLAVRKLTAEMVAAGAASEATAKKVGLVTKAANILGAAIVGWQIGDYLRQEFLVVERAGIALMSQLHKGWVQLVAFFKRTGASIKYVLTSPFSAVRQALADLFDDIAEAAAKIPKIGQDIAAGLSSAADFLEPATDAAKKYRADLKRINEETQQELKDINDGYLQLFIDAEKNRQAAKSKRPAAAPSKENTNPERQTKAKIVADQIALAKAEVDATLAELERLKSESLVSFADYYAKRRQLQLRQLDLQIKESQAELEKAKDDEARKKIITEIAILERRRGEIAEDARRGQIRAEQELQDQLEGVRAALLRLQGSDAEARAIALERQYKDLMDRLKIEGDEAGQAIIQRLIDTEVARARLDELRRNFQEAMSELRVEEQSVQARVETGEISPNQAEKEIVEIRGRQLEQMDLMIQKTRELAEATQDPEVLQALREMERSYEQAARKVNDVSSKIKDSLETSIGQGLKDLAEGAKDLKEVFRDMAVSVLKTLQDIIAKKIAAAIVTSVFHAGGVVGSGGAIRAINPAFIGAAPRYHAGGIAGLAPGEVPAILERGEEVLTRDDPRHVGNMQGQAAGSLKTIIIDDRDSVGDYMSSAAGEKVQLETIRRNSGVIKRMLG